MIELIVAYWEWYVLIAIGCTCGHVDQLGRNEIVACLIIGLMWPLVLISRIFRKFR